MRNDEYTVDFTPEERERWEEMKREPMHWIQPNGLKCQYIPTAHTTQ